MGITASILQEILLCSEILSRGIRWWAVQADIFYLSSSISKICNWAPAKAKILYLTEGTGYVVARINICYLKFSTAILHLTNITYLNTSKCFAESRSKRISVGVRAERKSAFKSHPNKLQLFPLRDCEYSSTLKYLISGKQITLASTLNEENYLTFGKKLSEEHGFRQKAVGVYRDVAKIYWARIWDAELAQLWEQGSAIQSPLNTSERHNSSTLNMSSKSSTLPFHFNSNLILLVQSLFFEAILYNSESIYY